MTYSPLPQPTGRAHADRLRTNLLDGTPVVDDHAPELSWQVVGSPTQTGYQILVRDSGSHQIVWDSGPVPSPDQHGVPYEGAPLASSSAYDWMVQLQGQDGTWGPPSSPATFTTGILDDRGWSAHWVTAPAGTPDDAVLYLRGELYLDAPILRARAYSTALGWYRLFVNGVDLTGPALVPRFTPFDKVVEYQVHELAPQLRQGRNVVGLVVADGRYRGRLGYLSRRQVYGDDTAGLVQVELELADGERRIWTTNGSWQATRGPIRTSDPKRGEQADLTIQMDWEAARPETWKAARILPRQPARLICEEAPQVGQIDRLPARRVWRSRSGALLVDFGENIAGVIRLRSRADRGTVVTLTHSEVLTPDGELDVDYVTDGRHTHPQRDEVVLPGTREWWQPWFTIHGFRYAQVDGLAHLEPDDIEAVVLSSQLQSAGSFTSSDARLNTLVENVARSTRGNFTDTPTDCPTRERSGWTGDLQAFADTATGVVDSHAYLRRYLRNLALDQEPDGRVPPFIPKEGTAQTGRFLYGLARVLANSAGWGDAAVRIPTTLHRYYGDERVLHRQWDSMCAWVDHLERTARRRAVPGLPGARASRRAGDLSDAVVSYGFHWGEWLRPGEHFPSNALEGTLHGAPVATAYLSSSAALVARAAGVIDLPDAQHRYQDLADRARLAWQRAFVNDDGSIGYDRQDDYVRALGFGLLEPLARAGAARRLADLVAANDYHLDTGFLSTPMLLPVLAEHGYPDVAFRLLMQTTSPSWLYQVERGATTVWETWSGHNPDGRARASHNHYGFGSVALFLREHVLGITPSEPGYRRIRIAPLLGGGLTHAQGHVDSPYGRIGVAWEANSGGGLLEVAIPCGTMADVRTPDGSQHRLDAGHHNLRWNTTAASPQRAPR